MPAAAAQAFRGVGGAGAEAPRSHATVPEGAVLASLAVAVRLCSPSGIPSTTVTRGQTCDWVRRQLR